MTKVKTEPAGNGIKLVKDKEAKTIKMPKYDDKIYRKELEAKQEREAKIIEEAKKLEKEGKGSKDKKGTKKSKKSVPINVGSTRI